MRLPLSQFLQDMDKIHNREKVAIAEAGDDFLLLW